MPTAPNREQDVMWLQCFYAAGERLGLPLPMPSSTRAGEIAELKRLRAKALDPVDALVTGDWPFKTPARYRRFADEEIRLGDFCRAYLPHLVRPSRAGWRPSLTDIKLVAAHLPFITQWGSRKERIRAYGCTGRVTLSCDTDRAGRQRVTWTFDAAFEILLAIARLFARYADHIRACPECRAVFIGVRRTRYCGPRCSATGRQRRWRQRRP